MTWFAKLMDTQGREIARPALVEGSVTWNQRDGKAQAWAADGKTLLAEMVNCRPVWLTHLGLRLEGMEPIDLAGTKFRAQQWQINFQHPANQQA